MNSKTYRADEYAIGSRVSVVGVPAMSKLLIQAVTFSAVHVVNDGVHTTISCGTPCVSCDDEVAEIIAEVVDESENVEDGDVIRTGKRGRPQGVQGKLIADKLDAFILPTTPFTIRQLVELTEIDQLYLISYIKRNCKEVGEEEKVPGKRGRAAKLYLKK